MYRHEKTPENSTALLTSVTGFEENPTEIFLAEMQNIVPEMQDLPFYHKGIECFCPKFVLFEDQWIGTVLTAMDDECGDSTWASTTMGTT